MTAICEGACEHESRGGTGGPGGIAKPPLGIMPERLWKECRAWDLIACLARHKEQPSVPSEWWDELWRLLDELVIPCPTPAIRAQVNDAGIAPEERA